MEATAPEHGRDRAAAVPAAFERLFRAEYARVIRVAFRVVADQDEAEDVAQEVFLAFYRAHPASADYATAWLHAAAAHTALNALRSRSRRTTRDAAQAIPQDPASPDPADSAEVAEARYEAHAVLPPLPQRDATILAAPYAGLSYAEISAAIYV